LARRRRDASNGGCSEIDDDDGRHNISGSKVLGSVVKQVDDGVAGVGIVKSGLQGSNGVDAASVSIVAPLNSLLHCGHGKKAENNVACETSK
jgi:hypothetical protein